MKLDLNSVDRAVPLNSDYAMMLSEHMRKGEGNFTVLPNRLDSNRQILAFEFDEELWGVQPDPTFGVIIVRSQRRLFLTSNIQMTVQTNTKHTQHLSLIHI